MVSALLSIAPFSGENIAWFFGNVRAKLPAPLVGLDSYWSTVSTLLFPLQQGVNHLIFTDNNEKPSLGLQEKVRLYCIWPVWRSTSRCYIARTTEGGNDAEHWPALGLLSFFFFFFLSEGWDGILLNLSQIFSLPDFIPWTSPKTTCLPDDNSQTTLLFKACFGPN